MTTNSDHAPITQPIDVTQEPDRLRISAGFVVFALLFVLLLAAALVVTENWNTPLTTELVHSQLPEADLSTDQARHDFWAPILHWAGAPAVIAGALAILCLYVPNRSVVPNDKPAP